MAERALLLDLSLVAKPMRSVRNWLLGLLLLATAASSAVIVVSEPQGGGEVSAGTEDWNTRSTESGVVFARNSWTTAEVDECTRDSGGSPLPDADHVSRETTNVVTGAAALRMDILKTDGAAAGQCRLPFGQEFGTGEPFYVQFRQYFPAYYATHPFAGSNNGFGDGWKQVIVSNNESSNQFFEVVLQNNVHRGLVQGYNRDTGLGFPPWETSSNNACNSTDFIFQNSIDRGYDDSTCLGARRRLGGLWSYGSNTGAPDPETGAFIFYPDEWLTFLIKVSPGGFGTGVADSQIEVWAARNGATAYIKLYDMTVDLGPDDGDGLFDAVWLLTYNTNREADATREDTYTLYDEVIVSTNSIAVPAVKEPEWMPAEGAVADIGTSVANDAIGPDISGKNLTATADTVFINWSGGVLGYIRGAPYLVVTGSGHGGDINGVYKFGPLTGENPEWSVLVAASDSGDIINDSPYWADGHPSANHTYNILAADGHYMWMLGMEASHPNAQVFPDTYRLDLDIGVWDAEDTWSNKPSVGDLAGGSVVVDDRVYYRGGFGTFGRLRWLTKSTDTWDNDGIDVYYETPPDITLMHDTTADRLIALGGVSGQTQYQTWTLPGLVSDVADESLGGNDVSGTNDFQTIKGAAYDPDRNIVAVPVSGTAAIDELDLSTFTFSRRNFSGDAPAAATSNGDFGRFRYVPEIGIYVYAPQYNQPVSAFNN